MAIVDEPPLKAGGDRTDAELWQYARNVVHAAIAIYGDGVRQLALDMTPGE